MTLEQKIRKGRHLARTDLHYLATKILGYKLIDREVHQPVIDHLVSFRGYQGVDNVHVSSEGKVTVDYTPIHDDPNIVLPNNSKRDRRRILMDPRGWFKTTLNVISHTIQGMLNFPQATWLITHAQTEIAQDKLLDIKNHFLQNDAMKFFFPEYCFSKRLALGNMREFDVPMAKRKTGAPTISVASMTSGTAGMHYHWIKFTDCVEFQNSQTAQQLKKVRDTINQYFNLL